MDINDLKNVLSDALQTPEDKSLRYKYCDTISVYLKDNEISEEVLSIVFQGIELDHAANFLNYLASLSKNNLQKIWKQVLQSIDSKEWSIDNLLTFLSCALTKSFMKIGNIGSLCGNILTELVKVIADDKEPVDSKLYGPILCNYIIHDLRPGFSLPQWQDINASDEDCRKFASIILKATDEDNTTKYYSFRQWAGRGLSYTEGQIKRRQIEEKIPKSRIKDLSTIVEHYRTVEKQLRDSVYQIAELQDEITKLNQNINTLHREKNDLEDQIHSLNEQLFSVQQQLDNAEKKVSEHAAINEAFGALKKNDETAMLKDIANALKAEYQDFTESKSDEMDLILGEIYREKLNNIFRILGKKGIRME